MKTLTVMTRDRAGAKTLEVRDAPVAWDMFLAAVRDGNTEFAVIADSAPIVRFWGPE